MRIVETKDLEIDKVVLGKVLDVSVEKTDIDLNLMYDPTVLISYNILSSDTENEMVGGSLLLNLHELAALCMSFIRERVTLADIMYCPGMIRTDIYLEDALVYSEKEYGKSELEILLGICQWLINNKYEVIK